MKILAIIISVVLGGVISYFLFSNAPIEIETRYEYLPGTPIIHTTTKIIYRDVPDIKMPADTVSITDSTIYAKTDYRLGNKDLGVKGTVEFIDSTFKFTKTRFNIPYKIDSVFVTDTLKINKIVEKPITPVFYKNVWFYISAGITTLAVIFSGK